MIDALSVLEPGTWMPGIATLLMLGRAPQRGIHPRENGVTASSRVVSEVASMLRSCRVEPPTLLGNH